ncbi:MAG: glycosyltransferase family 4 protein [Candidatus Cryptobacteroides sp.]
MRIVCLSRSLEVGGLERQLTGLAVLLKEAGHDVEVVKYIPTDFYEGFLSEHGIPSTYIPRKGGTIGVSRRIARHLKDSGTEMVICFGASANMKACIAKFFHRDFILVVSERNYIRHFKPNAWIRFALYSKAAWVISNSYSQHNHIVKSFPSLAQKSSAIVNFVNLNGFRPVERSTEDSSPLTITTISRVRRRKNLHGYIKAAALVRKQGLDFRIRWYGNTKDSSYYRRCLKMIGRLGLGDCFEILPATHDVKSVYDGTDIFCLPSFHEGTSNAIGEALACGLPVACSDVSDNGLYVRPGKNGWLFNPKDTRSMAETLSEIIRCDRSVFANYGMESRRTAEEKLSVVRFRKQYLELIEKLGKSEA